MSTKLHVWKIRLTSGEVTGHSALELSDGTYISWRHSKFTEQQETDGNRPVVSTLVDDSNFEGRPPNRSYMLLSEEIDECKIRKWWLDWQTTRQWTRQGRITPCFTVLEAVMAGKGWIRRDEGTSMAPDDLVNQLNRLGLIQKKRCVLQ